MAVPFVFADKGVKLAEAGEITFEDRTYDLVKATFEAESSAHAAAIVESVVAEEAHRVAEFAVEVVRRREDDVEESLHDLGVATRRVRIRRDRRTYVCHHAPSSRPIWSVW